VNERSRPTSRRTAEAVAERWRAIVKLDTLVIGPTCDEWVFRAAAAYYPLAKCLQRLDELRRKRRGKHARRWLAGLIFRLQRVPLALAVRPNTVRFVALSDTHRYHDLVDLPPGEVLLHLGDSVGNYGRTSDVTRHFEKFLSWLRVQQQRFAHIFFISGNHETFLDADATPLLERFLAVATHCTYLQDTSAIYRGIRIFGSPVTVSRLETEGKRYYSRAFERCAEHRATLWAGLPQGLDVLMTHCPPTGPLCIHPVGDSLLAQRLANMAAPPRFHVFGHDHDGLGIAANAQTVSMNVAQDEYLRMDPHGGGCALIFDVEPRDSSPESFGT